MDKVKVTLSRKVGPFAVWQWLLVIVVGVGLGLLIKRNLSGGGNNNYSGTALPSGGSEPGMGSTEGAPTIYNSPDFETIQGVVQGQDRLKDELDAIKKGQENFFTDIIDRIGKVNLPATPATPKPTVPKTTTPPAGVSQPAPTTRTYTVVKGDTLKAIAKRLLGSEARNVEIRSLNPQHVGSWDLIKPGEVLVIPSK